jgi:hypothetical protein
MKTSSHAAIADGRILVVGTVRNVEDTIEEEILNLRRSVSQFKSHSFFIVESDSEDNTLRVLEKIKNSTPEFQFTSLGKLGELLPNRIDRIAKARNEYVEFVKLNSDNFDYVLVADLDGVNTEISSEKIASCFIRSDWGGCTANQIGPYYDIYALRAKDWSDSDCWQDARNLINQKVHPAKAWRLAIRDRQIQIPEGSPWIEVDSAFGGLAIYRIQAFVLGTYASMTSRESNVSEHVAFHLGMREAGWKIYINPVMTNFEYNEHNDFHRVSRRVKYLIKYLISFIYPSFYLDRFMPELKVK